jgi:rhodanese-related sulfurtransferase
MRDLIFKRWSARRMLVLTASLGLVMASSGVRAGQPDQADDRKAPAPAPRTEKAPASARSLQPADFRKALEQARASGRAVLVDVREPSEATGGKVPDAELIPWNSGVFARDHARLPKDRPVFIYCRSGGRAKKAAELLASEGWTDVTSLVGGYEDLLVASPPH